MTRSTLRFVVPGKFLAVSGDHRVTNLLHLLLRRILIHDNQLAVRNEGTDTSVLVSPIAHLTTDGTIESTETQSVRTKE
jgi:hypothetical protein